MKERFNYVISLSLLICLIILGAISHGQDAERKEVTHTIKYDLTYAEGTDESGDFEGLKSSWLDYPGVIAHAGGAMREAGTLYTYTGCKEAFEQNYLLGHRVFEFDFLPTTDGSLALTHEWEDDKELTSSEWKQVKVEGKYTSLLIGDLLDIMVKYPDIYVVTDTKLTDDDDVKSEFDIIYKECMERDPNLLDRIVPQIYTNGMYGVIMDVYDWKSVIYTTYKTRKDKDVTAKDIVDFAKDKENICVITASVKDDRFGEEGAKLVHDAGMNAVGLQR